MYEENLSPLLAQLPLTVSPFVSLPTATTLPYTYKSLPASLPAPAAAGPATEDGKVKFILSPSGRAAHPDEVIASCQALRSHLQKLPVDAEKTLATWDQALSERDLAERRRVAPGWLDRNEKILEPSKATIAKSDDPAEQGALSKSANDGSKSVDEVENEIDRAFGGMSMR